MNNTQEAGQETVGAEMARLMQRAVRVAAGFFGTDTGQTVAITHRVFTTLTSDGRLVHCQDFQAQVWKGGKIVLSATGKTPIGAAGQLGNTVTAQARGYCTEAGIIPLDDERVLDLSTGQEQPSGDDNDIAEPEEEPVDAERWDGFS